MVNSLSASGSDSLLLIRTSVQKEPSKLNSNLINESPDTLFKGSFLQARHVQDHNSPGLPLTWDRAIQVYAFYRPTTLPNYDSSSKYCTISADTETLLKRIVALVPEEQNPCKAFLCVLYHSLISFCFDS